MENWEQKLRQKAEEAKKEQLNREKRESEINARLNDYLDKLHARDLLERVKMEAWGVGKIRKLESPPGHEIAWQLYYNYQDVDEIYRTYPPHGVFSAPEIVRTGRYQIVTRLASIMIGVMTNKDLASRTDLYFVRQMPLSITKKGFPYYNNNKEAHIINQFHSIWIDGDLEESHKEFLEDRLLASIAPPLPLSLEVEGRDRIKKLV